MSPAGEVRQTSPSRLDRLWASLSEERQSTRIVLLLLLWTTISRVLGGAFTFFWLDEIWSWMHAQTLHSALGVFSLHSDNNHHLNTLWLYLLGDSRNFVVARLPSMLAGVGCVALLYRIGRRRGSVQRLVAPVLGATSYLLLVYTTEARGYGLALFFSLLCLDQLQLILVRRSVWRAVVFGCGAVLGFLSHLTFLFAFAGLAAWACAALFKAEQSRRKALGNACALLIFPLMAFGLLYVIDLRTMEIGGGPRISLGEVIKSILALFSGLDPSSAASVVGAFAVVMCVLVEGALLARRRDTFGILYLFTLFVAPAAVMLLTKPEYLFPRYFVVCVPILILLMADLIADLAVNRVGAWAGAGIVALLVVGNVARALSFFEDGRGDYLSALLHVQCSAAAPGAVTTVGSSSDFRTQLVLEYYAPLLDPSCAQLEYVTQDRWSERTMDYYIHGGLDSEPHPAPSIALKGVPYVLDRVYPYSSLVSGFHWFVYRRATR